ncbi:MAG: HipA N-terminal domain-containing protein [Flavobacteriales bacterium]|jgi:serine/threonine-protein kinase HipA
MRKGVVFYKDDFAGIISEMEDGFSFQYDLAYLKKETAKPVSLTLPLQEKAYTNRVLFPFFDGLIPEGWLLMIAIEYQQIKPLDRFGMLLTLCKDNIGCVSVTPQTNEE